ncbi:MAG TPA: hypothetical protein ENJ82_09880 [Bacteroidetes bacterium]|nr:hypothetical protein [Bacteroidota bacterium]
MVEEKKLDFCIGLSSNAVLKAEIAEIKAEITEKYVEKKLKHQHFTDAFPYQAQSWNCAQNTYAKVESTGKGINVRFFISNLQGMEAKEIYFEF